MGVEGLDEFEEMSDRGREVEVVAQGIIPTLADIGATTLTLAHRGRGNFARSWAEADGELIEPLDRAVGGLEQLGRERQRTTVMRAGHERIADGARLIALRQDVAQCRKILESLRHLLAHRILEELGV